MPYAHVKVVMEVEVVDSFPQDLGIEITYALGTPVLLSDTRDKHIAQALERGERPNYMELFRHLANFAQEVEVAIVEQYGENVLKNLSGVGVDLPHIKVRLVTVRKP